jgi:hypothetical protein
MQLIGCLRLVSPFMLQVTGGGNLRRIELLGEVRQ